MSMSGLPEKIGRYQILERVGRGGMGVLYRAFDPVLDREVAVKVMLADFSDDTEQMRPRFYREAKAAAKLQHRNIVTVFEFAEENNQPHIVMEFLRGSPLNSRMTELPPLALPDKLDIVAQLCSGLGYAHTQGVVHRDVKPANMMYHLETDSLKVTDFGIARLTDSSKTKTGMVLGTPSFMSPEQLAGKKIEGRSDLFSLAVSLYQLLSGKLPFEGESMAQLMFKIASEPPTDILAVNPSVPPGLVAFLERALAKNPDDRYQTGAEFAAALRAAVSEAPAMAAAGGVDIEL